MKAVAVEFTYYTDIIEVPDHIADSIRAVQGRFDQWIYDKTTIMDVGSLKMAGSWRFLLEHRTLWIISTGSSFRIIPVRPGSSRKICLRLLWE